MVLSPQVALANTPVSCDVIRRRSPLSEDRLCTYLTNRSGLLLDTRTPLPKFSFFLTVIQYTVPHVLVTVQHVLVGLTMKVLFLNNPGVNMRQFLKFFRRDERGVTALEYAILAGIIVVALVAVGTTFSTNLQAIFVALTTKVSTTISGS